MVAKFCIRSWLERIKVCEDAQKAEKSNKSEMNFPKLFLLLFFAPFHIPHKNEASPL